MIRAYQRAFLPNHDQALAISYLTLFPCHELTFPVSLENLNFQNENSLRHSFSDPALHELTLPQINPPTVLNIYVRYVNRVCFSRARCVSASALGTRPHTSQAVYFSHFLSILQLSVGLTAHPCSCGQSITPAPPPPYQRAPADPPLSLPGRLLPAHQYSADVLPNFSPAEILAEIDMKTRQGVGFFNHLCHLIVSKQQCGVLTTTQRGRSIGL